MTPSFATSNGSEYLRGTGTDDNECSKLYDNYKTCLTVSYSRLLIRLVSNHGPRLP